MCVKNLPLFSGVALVARLKVHHDAQRVLLLGLGRSRFADVQLVLRAVRHRRYRTFQAAIGRRQDARYAARLQRGQLFQPAVGTEDRVLLFQGVFGLSHAVGVGTAAERLGKRLSERLFLRHHEVVRA